MNSVSWPGAKAYASFPPGLNINSELATTGGLFSKLNQLEHKLSTYISYLLYANFEIIFKNTYSNFKLSRFSFRFEDSSELNVVASGFASVASKEDAVSSS